MLRRKKDSSAARNRTRKSETIKVLEGSEIAAQHLRDGPQGLEAVFSGGAGERANKLVHLQFLDVFEPETMRAIAEGWTIWNASDATPTTRYVRMQRLKYGFIDWLVKRSAPTPDAEGSDIIVIDTAGSPESAQTNPKPVPVLAEIDEGLIQEFADWIGNTGSSGFVENRKLRQAFLHAIEEPLNRLSISKAWAPKLSPNWKRLVEPFGTKRQEAQRIGITKPKTKSIIGRADYDALWDKAARKVEADMALHEAELDALDAVAEEDIELSADTAASPARLATYLMRRYPGVVRGYIRNDRRGIYRRIVSRQQHEAAEALIYPDLQIILPFIYLTTALFALNVEVALGMTLDDYTVDEVPGGGKRIRIFPDKPRQDDRQRHAYALTEDADNPARFLPYLERRTAVLRRSAETADKRQVFLYFEHRNRYTWTLRKTIPNFGRMMQEFAQGTSLDHLSLKMLRLTSLDVVHDITNGNIVATRALAKHKSVGTTHTDYRTEAMRNRYEENQGEALEEWERFWRSGGKVDVAQRPNGLDRTAATPGYGCLDPKTSPLPTETDGQLCRAYGECPRCDHAVVFHRSPTAFRCLLALLERLEEAEREMPAAAYTARWAEVKTILALDHLKRFDPEIRKMAENVVVPKLPKLD